jgi:hypothetical protein
VIAGKHSIAAAFAAAIGVMALSNAALAQALTFELNDTRFYLPRAWTITPVHSRPAYEPKSAPPENTVFKVDRSIMLVFPHVATHPRRWYRDRSRSGRFAGQRPDWTARYRRARRIRLHSFPDISGIDARRCLTISGVYS